MLKESFPLEESYNFDKLDFGESNSLEAKTLLKQFYNEAGSKFYISERLKALDNEPFFTPSSDEIEFAARLAWRNSTRCIGRLFWNSLLVRDRRHISKAKEIFGEMKEHNKIATNNGRIRSVITIFSPLITKPDFIISPQLIRYAGYRKKGETVLGDPAYVELTQLALQNGWKGAGTEYDILPLIVKSQEGEILIESYDYEEVLEVQIKHPNLSCFDKLNLKWHALPALSNLCLDAFGLLYPVVFSGWYMATEIGCRNLSDSYRYNKLPDIAESMGLDTRNESTLWRDRALLELNQAVIHSFKKSGVTIVDHHNASREFMRFIKNEESDGRKVHADWSWIVPPMSGSLTPQFHMDFPDSEMKPAFVKWP